MASGLRHRDSSSRTPFVAACEEGHSRAFAFDDWAECSFSYTLKFGGLLGLATNLGPAVAINSGPPVAVR